ncbi:hypothetical protein SAMN02745121_06424 [Nannocystis exedens]|uniref:ADYC domain-containing protein n=1 Tax=Nannocystis exedens TaxID=54 RepID=A0A1I2F2K7_9BACT|nr:ADYC domain-containing protein [Nannocystis exedens]PCC69616.1 hypothetical protein NAEX_02640 [Nannocystis exedens]SFE99213.1 hypothetical protein SAMN02745121_06424 [Nannocystis exedens]
MRMLTVVCSLGVMAIGGACAGEEDGEPEFRDTGCPNCGGNGSNSAHANLYPIDTLNLLGEPNEAGVRVLGVEDPLGTLYALRTVGDELAAWDLMADTPLAVGDELVGWTIKLYIAEPAEELDIEILKREGELDSYVEAAPPISGYALAYHHSANYTELYSVCPDFQDDGPDVVATTIIRGELYEEGSKQVTVSPDWITIACRGNAVFKMKQMGYGPNQNFPGQSAPASPRQRQATIRMITADYCGDGTSFTADGTALDWQNLAETLAPHEPPSWSDVEALWDEDGALCLSNPRLATLADVAAHCTLPACTAEMQATAHEWTTWRVPGDV